MIDNETNKIIENCPDSREGVFVCEVCCENGRLEAVECGCLIFYCPDHMTLCIKDGEVIAYESRGVRQ